MFMKKQRDQVLMVTSRDCRHNLVDKATILASKCANVHGDNQHSFCTPQQTDFANLAMKSKPATGRPGALVQALDGEVSLSNQVSCLVLAHLD